ncbi:hypothetical protein [Paraburkholderia adhaesiva]|uniref:hypothetical protein n=1 Tax=Paraburkholderia adhaesiva TaxID=2883244 RepID=UPI001F17365D|nr:hypothetical protein [Paraburkholderia adhaesiva]
MDRVSATWDRGDVKRGIATERTESGPRGQGHNSAKSGNEFIQTNGSQRLEQELNQILHKINYQPEILLSLAIFASHG